MVCGNDQLNAKMHIVVVKPSVGLHHVSVANQILCTLMRCNPLLRQRSVSLPGSLRKAKPTVTTLISVGRTATQTSTTGIRRIWALENIC